MTRPLSILVFGKNGQLARALFHECKTQNIAAQFISSHDADLAKDPEQARSIIAAANASIIINASAYTQVDKAETDIDAAMALNSTAPAVMARACKATQKAFIHVSTDYVFPGNAETPYKVNHTVDPINTYGHSKADGEMNIAAIGGQSTIIRTSWVYDNHGKNFLTTMLRLAAERDELTIVHDQIGRPTYAAHLAQAALKIATSYDDGHSPSDMYHVTNSGAPISWADFARAIFAGANIHCHVKNITSEDYPTPAKRPSYSVLDISKFETEFGDLPTWQDGLELAFGVKEYTP